MKVLLIAPDLGLEHVKHEIRSISSSLHATILADCVERRDVMDAMQNDEWDVVWVAAHGKIDGIELSDGLLSTSDFTSIVRNTNAKLLVLNTCDSKAIGLELNYELGIDVVCVEGEVGDSGAYQMGRLLAQNLAVGLSPKAAFDRSKPGQNMRYHFLFGRKTANDGGASHDSRIDDARTIRMMHEVIGEWASKLNKRIDSLEQTLRKEIDELRNLYLSMQLMQKSFSRVVKLPPWYREVFFLAFLLLTLPIALFFEDIRDILDVGWQSAYTVAIMMYGGSMILWSYLWWGSSRDE